MSVVVRGRAATHRGTPRCLDRCARTDKLNPLFRKLARLPGPCESCVHFADSGSPLPGIAERGTKTVIVDDYCGFSVHGDSITRDEMLEIGRRGDGTCSETLL